MDISPVIFWNIVLTLVIAPAFWGFRSLIAELKRIDILLNKTREESATRDELRDDMRQVMDALHRVEDKLDKAQTRRKLTIEKINQANFLTQEQKKDLIEINNLKELFSSIRDYAAGNLTGITRDETIAQNLIRLLFIKI